MAENGFRNLLWFMGVVEDRRDPRKMGRVRVRCFDIHPDSKEDVPTETLPWAIPVIGSYDINYKPPIEGSWVFGFFLDGADAQHPMLLGVMPGMPTTAVNTALGFNAASDPNPHPVSSYQPDISRLARGEDIGETHVAGKFINQEHCPAYPWSEPPPPYNAEYPYNKVQETESGHVFEMDDTPGSERINIHHASGTFTEVGPTGTRVNKIIGDDVTIVEKNGRIMINGTADVVVKGTCNVTVESDCNLTVDGSLNTNVHGDYNLNVAGGIYMNSGDIFAQRSSAIRQEAFLDNYNVFANKSVYIQAQKDNIHIYANTGFVSAYANTDVRIESGANTYFDAAGKTNIKATGNIAIDGAKIDLNTSGAVEVDPGFSTTLNGVSVPRVKPSGKQPAFKHLFPDPPDRKFPIETEFEDDPYSSFTDPPELWRDTHPLGEEEL